MGEKLAQSHNPGKELDRLVLDRSQRSKLRFYVIGDFGSGDEGQVRVAEAMTIVAAREPPDFVIGTGDSLYPLDERSDIGKASMATILAERFDPYYERLGVDFFQCIGNEDLVNVFGGYSEPMVAHTWQSAIWRMPAPSYRIPRLPPWIAMHVAHTSVFGFAKCVAEEAVFSEELMAREIDALTQTFSLGSGFRILVGHHPVFTAGKRTFRYNGDGELLYMRRLRRAIEHCGVHLYFSGHEHQQSHMTGPTCEHIIQGCGGARDRPNRKHPRREEGWRDGEKILRHMDVIGGFAVVEVDSTHGVRLRFFGVRFDEPAHAVRVIYERRWKGLGEIGDRSLRTLTLDQQSAK